MRNIRRMAGILAGLAIFVRVVYALNYLYGATDDAEYYSTWHSYYEEEGKITTLFLGSSHVHRDIDPWILDEITGEYNFNLSSAKQSLNGTFYLLREADRNNALKHIYLEMYYICSAKDNFNKNVDPIDTRYHYNWQNTDQMKMSANKLAYMLNIAGTDRYIDVLLPFSRYRSKLGDWEYVTKNIEEKKQRGTFLDQGDDNWEKRFYGSAEKLTDEKKCCHQERILEEHPIGEKSNQYLRKIILYCQERDIPITLFISPMYDLQLVSTVNYDNYVNEVREIANTYDIPFYDFNLAKEAYFPIQNDEYDDLNHLNTAGAERFSCFLGQVIQQEESENQKYFYDSYTEKLRETAPAIYGIYYRDMGAGIGEGTIRKVYVASNRDAGMEYRIILTPEEGEQYTVQDFDENKAFTISPEEHGICTIVARMTDHPDEVVQTMEIDY